MYYTATITALLLSHTMPTASLYPTSLVHQYAPGIWLENLAVRSNGHIVATSIVTAELFSLDPTTNESTTIHTFASNQFPLGITETSPDTFQVNTVRDIVIPGDPSCAPNSTEIYSVVFSSANSDVATVTLTASVPGIIFANGLATLNAHTLLAVDSKAGTVWAVDITTGTSSIAISDPILLPPNNTGLGIDGIKISHATKTVYLTNEAAGFFARVAIDIETGKNVSEIEVLAKFATPDDFAVDAKGEFAYVASYEDGAVVRVDLETGGKEVVAGGEGRRDVEQPCACAFGRNGDEGILFVVTVGGFLTPIEGEEGGTKVVAVDVGGYA